jgi:hypothetical protein
MHQGAIVNVTTLLLMLAKLACTVIAVPTVALPEIVPVPLPWVNVKNVGLELIQVTDCVMTCGPLLFGNVASAVKVTVVAGGGLLPETVRVIVVGVPSVTVTVVVAAATVPLLALIVVVQTPVTLLTGATRPDVLMVAQLVVLELHKTLPVKSCCDPSL